MKSLVSERVFRPAPVWIWWALAGLLLIGVTTSAPPAAAPASVVAHVGSITVSVTGLNPGRSDLLTGDLRVTTTAMASDQLDAALAGGNTAVAVYHRQVSVGEIPDLASCDGDLPPPSVVDNWLHYGPLLVPGRSGGSAPPADAILTVAAPGRLVDRRAIAVTLYFADAGALTVDVPVHAA